MTLIWTDNPRGPDQTIIPQNRNVDLGTAGNPFNNIYANNIVSAAEVLPNNTFLKWVNAAGSANLNVIKADASDNTVINAGTGKSIVFDFNSVANTTFSAASVVSSITSALFGAATASTVFIGTNSVDAADSNVLELGAGSAYGQTRGGNIQLIGNEASSGGGILLETGNPTNAGIIVLLRGSASQLLVRNSAAATMWAFSNSNSSLANDATTGGNVVFNKALSGVANNIGTLAATGTNQGNSAAIAATVTRVTAADGTVGVHLPALSTVTAGQTLTIINSSTASALKVYSNAAGETITGQSGTTAISVAAKCVFRATAYDSSNWYGEISVTPY